MSQFPLCPHGNDTSNFPCAQCDMESELEALRRDVGRLDFCDTMIDLEPGFYVLRFPVTESCTIRQAIDCAIGDKCELIRSRK